MSKSTTNLKFIAFSRVTFGFKEHPIKHCGVILVKKCVSLGQEFRSLHDQYPNWIICFVPHKLPQSGFESGQEFLGLQPQYTLSLLFSQAQKIAGKVFESCRNSPPACWSRAR